MLQSCSLCHCQHVASIRIMTATTCVSADLAKSRPQVTLAILAQHASLDSVPHCHMMIQQLSAAYRWHSVLHQFARNFLDHQEAEDGLVACLTAAACIAQLCATEHNDEDRLGAGPFCLQVEQQRSFPFICCGISYAIGVSSRAAPVHISPCAM